MTFPNYLPYLGMAMVRTGPYGYAPRWSGRLAGVEQSPHWCTHCFPHEERMWRHMINVHWRCGETKKETNVISMLMNSQEWFHSLRGQTGSKYTLRVCHLWLLSAVSRTDWWPCATERPLPGQLFNSAGTSLKDAFSRLVRLIRSLHTNRPLTRI